MQRFAPLFAALALAALPAHAAEAPTGRDLFMNHCAACHGADGEGGGPVATVMQVTPPNLRALAQRNGGTFPTRDVIEMIDGCCLPRVGAHGPREMPVWGDVFTDQVKDDPTVAKLHPEWTVRARITALVDYLGRLQVK